MKNTKVNWPPKMKVLHVEDIQGFYKILNVERSEIDYLRRKEKGHELTPKELQTLQDCLQNLKEKIKAIETPLLSQIEFLR